ncbi:MAG TPA: hypothetical protein VGN81_19200 [Pseudonocardiaceae bacterium]|jgi:hypothetical protein
MTTTSVQTLTGNVTSTTAVAQPAAVHNSQSTDTGSNGGGSVVIIVIIAVVVFFVLARMLRGAFAMVGNLFSSAGAVFGVLVGLVGVGTLLLTTVITVLVNR